MQATKKKAKTFKTRNGDKTLTAILLEQAEAFLKRLELSGAPETRAPTWPIQRAGFIAGYVSGGDFGYTLANRLNGLPTKEEDEEAPAQGEAGEQLELPLGGSGE